MGASEFEESMTCSPLSDRWNTLKTECANCRACALCGGRTNLVFGVGNEQAELMFIGEGPGEQEDLQGVPFVGPAGKLLDSMLEMIDLDRSQVYIANIVKCRPPHNRDPKPEEMTACRPWLEPGGFPHHPGTRSVVRGKRAPHSCHFSPLGAAAGSRAAAGGFHGSARNQKGVPSTIK